MRFITVPYAIAWLKQALVRESGRELDLFLLWRNQDLSDNLARILKEAMLAVDAQIQRAAPGGLVHEWAKKKECWEDVKNLRIKIDFDALADDCISERRPRPVYKDEEAQDLELKAKDARLREIPEPVWARINTWAREHIPRAEGTPDVVWSLTQKVRSGMDFTLAELEHGLRVLNAVLEQAPDLLSDADEVASQERESRSEHEQAIELMNLALVLQIMAWDRRARRLFVGDFNFLKTLRDRGTDLSPSEGSRVPDYGAGHLLRV